MIPIENQTAPNVIKRYFCSNCGEHIVERRWNCCPICGEKIEWDKVIPITWKEVNCEVCGSWLVKVHPLGFPYSSSDYIDGPVCRCCQEDHCSKTDCSECKIGSMPGCKYEYIKKYATKEKRNE